MKELERPVIERDPKKRKPIPEWEPKTGEQVVATIDPFRPNASQLRDIRRQVKYVASLVSTKGRIREQMGDRWAANFQERIIYWNPIQPFPPFSNFTATQILFLTTHEAGHLNYTGGYEIPDGWSFQKREAFHTFWNYVEDIRIERLEARDLPGFGRIRPECNRSFLDQHVVLMVPEWAPWAQVGRNWCALENGCALLGTDELQQFARELWPDVTRVCNASSSDGLAQAIIPIFEKLWRELPSPQGGSGDESEDGDGDGGGGESSSGISKEELEEAAEELKGLGDGFGDQPSDNPKKSPMGSGQKPPGTREVLEQIKKGAGAKAKKLIQTVIDKLAEQEQQGDALADVAEGGERPGRVPAGSQEPGSWWEDAAAAQRSEITRLSHRLRTVLKTNAAGSWNEGLRRGRMNTHRASKTLSGNMRIFRKRTQIGHRDYVWGMIVDVSGSMSNSTRNELSKCEYALRAAVLLGESFERVGFPWFLIPWDTELRIRKSLTRRLGSVKEQLGADIAQPMGGTYEAPALIASIEEFMQVPSGHRTLFVISDGQTNGVDESKRIADELESMGVNVIAIGIGIKPPAHHRTRVQVEDASQLVELLPHLVNELVRKGGGA